MKTEQARLCVARGRAYDLLAAALLDGLRADRVSHFRAVPSLAPHIDEVPHPDTWAAAHHTALALEVPPFQSAFLSESGQMDDGDAVRTAYARGGFGGTRSDVPADHAGIALQYLSWLCGAESDAICDAQTDAQRQVQDLAREFIDGHLGRWIAALAVGLRCTPGVHPFFVEVAVLSAELVSEHRASLGSTPSAWQLPQVPDPLSDPQTRLADLAQHLCTPSLAGGVLSRGGLRAVGRATAVPKGFGSRALMLTNLLRSAAEFDHLGQALDNLHAVAKDWAQAHHALNNPVWATRAEQTCQLLIRMKQAAESTE